MLAGDEGQVRWWGLDMRSRRRRRWMVVGCYLVLFAAFLGAGTEGRWKAHPYIVFWGMVAGSVVWERLSIFGKNSPVKDLRDRFSIRISGLGELVRVTGLDERARYKFGVESFEAASEEQKSDLLNTHKVGTYWMPKDRDKTPWLDERELRERDNAERWALQQVVKFLGLYTGIWFSDMARHGGKLDGGTVVFYLMFGTLLAQTLPKARILWTEPDPRELSGEMALVESVEA